MTTPTDKSAADQAKDEKAKTEKAEPAAGKVEVLPAAKDTDKAAAKSKTEAAQKTAEDVKADPVPPKAADKPVTPPKPPGPPSPQKGAGFPLGWTVSMVIAAILGGVVVQYGLPSAGLSGAGGASAKKVAALEETVSGLEARLTAADLGALRQRLSELEASVAVLGGAGAAGAEGTAPPPAGTADLNARLQSTAEMMGRLSARIDALEAAGLEGATTGEAGEGGQKLAAGFVSQLQADMTGLRSRLDALTQALNQRAAGLNDRVQALETTVPSDLLAQLDARAAQTDFEKLNERLSVLERNTTALDAKRAAAAIALANLSRAAMTGQQFPRELEAVQILDGGSDEIGLLADFASTGVRPSSALLAEFGTVARTALREAGRGGNSWWDRLLANLANLFLIRHRDTLEGDTVEAIVNRAENAADAGNLFGAVSEMRQLTGPAAEAVQPWLKEAEARLELDRLITDLSRQLLEGLAD